MGNLLSWFKNESQSTNQGEIINTITVDESANKINIQIIETVILIILIIKLIELGLKFTKIAKSKKSNSNDIEQEHPL